MNKKYSVIELFAGAGGLSLGFDSLGFEHKALFEKDQDAALTLTVNKPDWNVICEDVRKVDFSSYSSDVVVGGFPCQSYSYAGKKLGMNDDRGLLIYDFVRAIEQIQPKIVIGENVKGLLTHDNGLTLKKITKLIEDVGYVSVNPELLNSYDYNTPQKRERLILPFIRKDIKSEYRFPKKLSNKPNVRDAFIGGGLYKNDVPESDGYEYNDYKKSIFDLVPEGGNWKSLPKKERLEYMGSEINSGGGNTGYARRLSWTKPSPTLLCSPSQRQTERCHPEKTRPLNIREYARIQTFPDYWKFQGSISSQYKQIGNAVPVHLGICIANSVKKFLKRVDVGDFKQRKPNFQKILG